MVLISTGCTSVATFHSCFSTLEFYHTESESTHPAMRQSQSTDTRLVKVSMAFVSGHSKENRQLMLRRLNSVTAFGEGFLKAV